MAALSKNEAFKSALVDGLRDLIQFQSFRQKALDSAIEMCDVLASELNTVCTVKDVEITEPAPEL